MFLFVSGVVFSLGTTSVYNKSNLRKLIDLAETFPEQRAGFFVFLENGESFLLDSSSFVQYAYRSIFGIPLPRESYGQYKYLLSQNLFQATPKLENGEVDIETLSSNLKRGDLLFWINTHSDIPTFRVPPVSHVMIYLGKSKQGNHLMLGVGSKGIGKRKIAGGVDIYVFHPSRFMGCVKDPEGNCIIDSEFIGHGRPKKVEQIYE